MAELFVTVGTTEFGDLVEVVLGEAFAATARAAGFAELTVQIGRQPLAGLPRDVRDALASAGSESDKHAEAALERHGLSVTAFRFKPSIAEYLARAGAVVSHAGAGSVFESVRAGRRLLVVVNPGLMDNHQSELAAAMAAGGHLSWTTPEEGRVCAALAALPASFAPLPSPAPALDAVAAVLRQET